MKVALVTGGSSGLGAEIAVELARRGWTTYAASRRGTRTGDAENLHALILDVTDETAVDRAVEHIVAEHGRLDAVVANAGVNASAPFEELPAKLARALMETNFWGAVHAARAALPVMRRQRYGVFCTIGSLGGLVGTPGEALYCASKHALEGFLESLQYEVAPFGIRLVLVEPGFIQTRFADSMPGIAGSITEYADTRRRLDAHWRRSIDRGMAATAVAARVVEEIENGRSRFRLRIGRAAHCVPALKRLMPERWFFSAVRRVFGIGPANGRLHNYPCQGAAPISAERDVPAPPES